MQAPTDSSPPKESVNLKVNSSLLSAAHGFDIDLPAILEAALTQAVTQTQRERWLAENRSAIVAYNERVETEGVFSDGLRGF